MDQEIVVTKSMVDAQSNPPPRPLVLELERRLAALERVMSRDIRDLQRDVRSLIAAAKVIR